MKTPSEKRRCGHTLMELVVSMTSATLLLTGLASALVIATSAFNLDSGKQAQTTQAASIQADMMADLQHALSFSERTATAVTFTVPDRDGDTIPETIRYAWSGTLGDPLTYQYNGGTVVNVAEDVQSFDLSFLTRTMIPFNCSPPTFEEFTETKRSSGTETISLTTPAGTLEGDLLIAALATDEEMSDYFVAPSGWTLIGKDSYSDDVALGVWWKIAGASESSSHTFTWYAGESEEAYGWIMRFTGHDPDNPIHAHSLDTNGNDYTPNSPAVTTTIDNALILRLGAFDDDDVTHNSTGLSGHTTITMDESGSGDGTCSGGAGYEILETAGDSGAETFSLNDDEQSVTITVAITGAGCSAIPSGCSPPVYEEFSETIASSASTSLNVSTPAGTAEGDLLIAAVCTHQDNENYLSAPAGWTVLTGPHNNDHATLGVWYKLASASESSSHNFSWSGGLSEKSYGWIMRFTGHDPATPIDDWAYTFTGDSTSPVSPPVTTTAPNALILRLGAFHNDDINTDAPGLSGHTAITMDGNDKISGGAGYVSQSATGDSGSSNFSQTGSQESVTVTIAIAGADCGATGGGGSSGLEYQNFAEKNVSDTTSVTINKPTSTASGDLLIAAVATEKDRVSSISPPSGWTLVAKDNFDDKTTLAIYWKTAGGSEPSTYNFSWSSNSYAYGWISRFTGHDTSGPIDDSSISVNNSTSSPTSPAVITTVNNAMIVRFGAFVDGAGVTDDTGLSGHTTITVDGNVKVDGGAGYVLQSSSGSSGTSSFSLAESKESVTMTIAIKPAP